MRCSTVVPGKLAVLARRPVSALKSVVLPAFGLPTSARVKAFACGGGAMEIFPNRFLFGKISVITPVEWQSLMSGQVAMVGRADFEPQALGERGGQADARAENFDDERVAG